MSAAPPPGIYVPAVLFFTSDEELDEPAIRAHVLRLAQGGVAGILVQGSNGEAQHLSHAERAHAIRLTRQVLDEHGFEKTVIIAGTGAQTTRETRLLNEEAHKAGAAFGLVLTPSTWFAKMTPATILRFHREVADVSPIPCMIYNFPSVTAGIDLDSDLLTALAQHPNIVGTKLSCANIGKLHRLTSSFPASSFSVFPGASAVALQGLLSGAAGVIAALPNVLPKTHVRLFALWKEGKVDEAMALQAKLGHADWTVGKIGGVGGIKAIVSKYFGYGEPWVRGPLASGDVQALDEKSMGVLVDLIEMEKAL